MHYRKHIFCCVNERASDHPRSCCSARGSIELRAYMKKRAKELGLNDIRVNNAGCLERCELGPTMVIYPQGNWYHYNSTEDIEEILQCDVIDGNPVERLLLKDGQKYPSSAGFLRLNLKVSAIEYSTSDALKIELVNTENNLLPKFTAGSHIDLLVGENEMRRSYSLANDSSETGRYVIGVLNEKDGRGGSQWIHGQLQVGDVVHAGCPSNNFQLDESATSHVLIAGGIGVVPILSMCYRLRSIGAEFTVHYCAKSQADAPFLEEIKSVCGNRLNLYFDGGDPRRGINLPQVLKDYDEGSHLYVCGPTGLMDSVFDCSANWPDDSKHREAFHSELDKTWESHEFDVVLSRRQTKVTVNAEQTILEALCEAQVIPDYSCTEGLCGACRTGVLFGEVEHRDAVLSESEKLKHNQMMICVSRAAKGETQLILDI